MVVDNILREPPSIVGLSLNHITLDPGRISRKPPSIGLFINHIMLDHISHKPQSAIPSRRRKTVPKRCQCLRRKRKRKSVSLTSISEVIDLLLTRFLGSGNFVTFQKITLLDCN